MKILLTLLLLQIGCGGANQDPDRAFGLPRIDVQLSEENYTQVFQGGKRKIPVSGRIRIKGAWYSGELSLSGAGSINHMKKSFRFDIAESEKLPPSEIRSLKLSAQVQDPSFLRTILGYHVYRSFRLLTPQVDPVILFLNGELFGLYMSIERINEDFFLRRKIDPDRIYQNRPLRARFDERTAADPESSFESKDGGFHEPEISRLAQWAETEPTEENHNKNYLMIESSLDLLNATRYFGANLFMGNCDGFINNIYLFKSAGDARLQFLPWDWERVYDGSCGFDDLKNQNQLVKRMLDYPEIQDLYRKSLSRLVAIFTREEVKRILDLHAERLREAHQSDPYLSSTGTQIEEEKDRILKLHDQWTIATLAYLKAS